MIVEVVVTDVGKESLPATSQGKCFLVVEPNKIIFLIYNTKPMRRILSYSILGTIVSPNKILLTGFGIRGPPYVDRL